MGYGDEAMSRLVDAIRSLKVKPSGCPHHSAHLTQNLSILLDGQPGLPDVPAIPQRLRRRLPLMVFRYDLYRGLANCLGNDVVSEGITTQGIWEGYETVLVLDILDRPSPGAYVMDIGSQLGWYSALARYRWPIIAIDNEGEALTLTWDNAHSLLGTPPFTVCQGWIDEDAPIIPAKAEPIHFAKIDIEGNEVHAVRMLSDLFLAGKVDYALIEISPVFNDTYPDLVEWLADCEYGVFQIPPKGWAYTQEYSEDPLGTLLRHCEIPGKGRREYVAGLRQENFVFVRR
jgi:hypothetical protein